MSKYAGSQEFAMCRMECHEDCPGVRYGSWMHFECSCSCHATDPEQEARECAGADDERRRAQFHADVKAIFGGPF